MALVDDRGRMFGRFNPVDVFAFAVVVVMIPVAYGAYALFRTPPAKLNAVEPKQLMMGPNLRVRIDGTNLRPFMRVSFNTVQGRTFMIGSTTSAQIDLPDLDPGTYDVVLYDYAQEVDRLPKALTILPRVSAPTAKVEVDGRFVGLNQTQVDALKTNAQFQQGNHVTGRVLAVGTPLPGALQLRTGETGIAISLPGTFDLPAALELECFVETNTDGSVRCTAYGPAHAAAIIVDAVVSLPVAGAAVNFQVNAVNPAGKPAFVRVRARAMVTADTLGHLRAGDTDATTPAYPDAWIGRVESVGANEVILRLPAQQLVNGWRYRNQWLKVGGNLKFETAAAVINGAIVDLKPIDAPATR